MPADWLSWASWKLRCGKFQLDLGYLFIIVDWLSVLEVRFIERATDSTLILLKCLANDQHDFIASF